MKVWGAIIGVILLVLLLTFFDYTIKTLGTGFSYGLKFAGIIIGIFVIFVLYEKLKN